MDKAMKFPYLAPGSFRILEVIHPSSRFSHTHTHTHTDAHTHTHTHTHTHIYM